MTHQQKIGNRLLTLAIPGTVILDIIYGLVGQYNLADPNSFWSPGILGRGLLFAFSVLIAVTYRRPEGQLIKQWAALMVFCFTMSLVAASSSPIEISISAEIKKTFKLLFGPFLTVMLCYLVRRYNVPPRRLLEQLIRAGYFLAFSVLLPGVFNLGEATYGSYASGSTGFLTAQNDVGVALSLAYIISIYFLFVESKLKYFVTSGLIALALLELGTRYGTVACVLFPPMMAVICRGRLLSVTAYSKTILAAIMIIPAAMYFIFQRVEVMLSETYTIRKYEAIFDGEITRISLLENSMQRISSRPLWMDLFGEGANSYSHYVGELSGVFGFRDYSEIDPVDLFGSHGLAGFIVIYGFYLSMWRRVERLPTSQVGTEFRQALHLCFAGFLVHSCLAGHAVASPLPLTAIATVIAFVLCTEVTARSHTTTQP